MTDEPYRPSNGTEGDWFYAAWCANCWRDRPDEEVYCPIWGLALAMDLGVNISQYPKELVMNEHGVPRCTAFADLTIPLPEPRCDKTEDLFGG